MPKITGKQSLADSPWLWVLMFAVFASVALAAIGPKYARRQAKLETKYAGRTAAMGDRQEDSTPPSGQSRTIVPITTLAFVFAVIALAAGARLWWQFGRRSKTSDRDDTPQLARQEAHRP
jgi:hypothetical protein